LTRAAALSGGKRSCILGRGAAIASSCRISPLPPLLTASVFCRLLPPLASKANPTSSTQRKAAIYPLFGITSLLTLLALIAEIHSECCSCRHCCFMNRSSVCYDLFFSLIHPSNEFF
jgi:hypothetical protein